MKKQNILPLLQQLMAPVILILLGLILMVNPDTASALISRIIGWILTACGVGTGIFAFFSQTGKIGKAIAAILMVLVGGWLISNPLALVAWISRFLGTFIMINSISDLIYAYKQGRNILFDAIAAAVGAVLVLLPLTASRLVFSACGVAVLVIGAVMLADRIRHRRFLPEGDDPNIIDAL